MDAMNSAGFVSAARVLPDIMTDIRYYTSFNFVGERIDGYEAPCALMTKETARALREVSCLAMERGYRLKLFDAYRPKRAVQHFVRWAENVADVRMKPYFYPQVDKSRLFQEGYIASRSNHSRGSTVDLTLFDMRTGQDVDMGGPFDFFGDLSHADCQGITDTQWNSRMLLRDWMMDNGFKGINSEWWHFTLKSEPYPDTYFDFPVTDLEAILD